MEWRLLPQPIQPIQPTQERSDESTDSTEYDLIITRICCLNGDNSPFETRAILEDIGRMVESPQAEKYMYGSKEITSATAKQRPRGPAGSCGDDWHPRHWGSLGAMLRDYRVNSLWLFNAPSNQHHADAVWHCYVLLVIGGTWYIYYPNYCPDEPSIEARRDVRRLRQFGYCSLLVTCYQRLKQRRRAPTLIKMSGCPNPDGDCQMLSFLWYLEMAKMLKAGKSDAIQEDLEAWESIMP